MCIALGQKLIRYFPDMEDLLNQVHMQYQLNSLGMLKLAKVFCYLKHFCIMYIKFNMLNKAIALLHTNFSTPSKLSLCVKMITYLKCFQIFNFCHKGQMKLLFYGINMQGSIKLEIVNLGIHSKSICKQDIKFWKYKLVYFSLKC